MVDHISNDDVDSWQHCIRPQMIHQKVLWQVVVLIISDNIYVQEFKDDFTKKKPFFGGCHSLPTMLAKEDFLFRGQILTFAEKKSPLCPGL